MSYIKFTEDYPNILFWFDFFLSSSSGPCSFSRIKAPLRYLTNFVDSLPRPLNSPTPKHNSC